MKKIFVIHGPHLDRLGDREHGFYGVLTLEQVNDHIMNEASKIGMEIDSFQSNSEDSIVSQIRLASQSADGIIINPAGLGYSSLMLRDAVLQCKIPIIEVHLSNIHAREKFRRKTIIADICMGQISGFKWAGYLAALHVFRLFFNESI